MKKKPKATIQPPDLTEGMRVRRSSHDQGHIVARNLVEAVCGLDLTTFGEDEWMAEDTRQAGACARCRSGPDYTKAPSTYDPWAALAVPPPRLSISREGRMADLQFEGKVEMVRRLLGVAG